MAKENLLLNVYPCVNSSENGNFCKSSEEIKNSLNLANFAVYFTTYAVDPANFEHPVVCFGKEIYTPISSSTLTYIEMLFGHFSFITDEGYVFGNLQTIKSASFLSSRQVLSFRQKILMKIK